MIVYKSLYDKAETELIINKSRFIARITPVEDYDEAKSFISEVQSKYKDATHNVPALVCGYKQEIQWASDDGEPKGTSGAPMLNVILSEGITNVAIVVTRYFGGTLLGTGGLVRAYSESARKGIEAARKALVKEKKILKYRIEYHLLGKIINSSKNDIFSVTSTEYSDKVELELMTDSDKTKILAELIKNICSGRELLINERTEFVKERI